MNLVEWLQRLMTNFGAGWVLWLLLVLSIISVAIMLERGWFYWSLRDDIARLASDLRERLRDNDLEAAKKRMEASPSAEAAVVALVSDAELSRAELDRLARIIDKKRKEGKR